MKFNNENTDRLISKLPPRIASYWMRCGAELPDEMRMTLKMPLMTVKNGEITLHDINVGCEDLSYTVRALSAQSLYAHSDTLKDGYITSSDGIRAGVVGKACTVGGKINSVTDITSVVLRVAKRYRGASHSLCEMMEKENYRRSVLLCAPPSGGKTTALREFVCEICERPYLALTALVDTRCEIASGISQSTLVTLGAYPRAKGVEIAVRTLSPRLVVCDEVYDYDDCRALEYAVQSGVCFAATAHGTSKTVSKTKLFKTVSETCGAVLYDIVKKDGTFEFRRGDAS